MWSLPLIILSLSYMGFSFAVYSTGHLFICSIIHQCISTFLHLLTHSSIDPPNVSIHPFICLSICPLISSVCPSTIHLWVHPSICPSLPSSRALPLSIHLSIHSTHSWTTKVTLPILPKGIPKIPLICQKFIWFWNHISYRNSVYWLEHKCWITNCMSILR